MSKPSRKRHPEGQPRFRRRYATRSERSPYGVILHETSSEDAPLTPRQLTIWHVAVLVVIALGFTALIVLGH